MQIEWNSCCIDLSGKRNPNIYNLGQISSSFNMQGFQFKEEFHSQLLGMFTWRKWQHQNTIADQLLEFGKLIIKRNLANENNMRFGFLEPTAKPRQPCRPTQTGWPGFSPHRVGIVCSSKNMSMFTETEFRWTKNNMRLLVKEILREILHI